MFINEDYREIRDNVEVGTRKFQICTDYIGVRSGQGYYETMVFELKYKEVEVWELFSTSEVPEFLWTKVTESRKEVFVKQSRCDWDEAILMHMVAKHEWLAIEHAKIIKKYKLK